ncbi:unannotated protein [freshwater metagenome]|uniref:Unannotated protein n=1 Tax=freshwater metagenome TaxID=449393 RepID=A0A6J7DTB1_9ZZZZ
MRGRLLDRLEQHIDRLVGEPVGVLHHDDVPVGVRRRQRCLLDEVARVVDEIVDPLGPHHLDIGVTVARGGAAGLAHAAAILRADERCGEAGCGRGAPGSRRAGEQPRVGHGRPRLAARAALGVGHRPLQVGDHVVLPDEGLPDAGGGHASSSSGLADNGSPSARSASSASTLAAIVDARPVIEAVASSTR